ncbi:hypothetical protein TrLO_g12659 [Triparma laevis f. longispina]|uniref:Uncharacterized protein n=1 Tax=Triparma laevis f. longispina TaxID=1714387 RepID=A0A9W7CEW0_9STRA|nr:hypothetical protein TrLO_g12659 [Triparma laevis f. longispina]
MMLWYMPVLQNTAQCWGLAKWVHITTGCICLFIGIGFPAFIVWKSRKLKNADKLSSRSPWLRGAPKTKRSLSCFISDPRSPWP